MWNRHPSHRRLQNRKKPVRRIRREDSRRRSWPPRRERRREGEWRSGRDWRGEKQRPRIGERGARCDSPGRRSRVARARALEARWRRIAMAATEVWEPRTCVSRPALSLIPQAGDAFGQHDEGQHKEREGNCGLIARWDEKDAEGF